MRRLEKSAAPRLPHSFRLRAEPEYFLQEMRYVPMLRLQCRSGIFAERTSPSPHRRSRSQQRGSALRRGCRACAREDPKSARTAIVAEASHSIATHSESSCQAPFREARLADNFLGV